MNKNIISLLNHTMLLSGYNIPINKNNISIYYNRIIVYDRITINEHRKFPVYFMEDYELRIKGSMPERLLNNIIQYCKHIKIYSNTPPIIGVYMRYSKNYINYLEAIYESHNTYYGISYLTDKSNRNGSRRIITFDTPL